MVRNLLKYLKVLQEVSNKNKSPKLGRGFSTAIRVNPWNPLSYLTLLIILFVGVVCFGVVGFWKETDLENPFKWN